MSFNRSLLSQLTKDVDKKPSAPKKNGEYTPKKKSKGGQIIFEEGGEFVDLQKKYGVDPLSKVGIEKARELAAKDPSIKFVCNASGCAQIAADAADAYDQNFSRGNAWDMGNLNQVNYLNPKYAPFMGQTGPLPDPKGYNVPKDVMNSGMQIIGLNRPNNLRSNENKRVCNTDKTRTEAMAPSKDFANDSYDYANRALYPDTRGYEHVGFNLGDGKLLHGTGANSEHPAFYTIDNMKDGISLPGYGNYDAVEAMSPSSMWQKMKNTVGLKKQGGQTRDEREMVNGIADILSQVNDPQNRAQIANQMVSDFKRDDVTYNLEKFMQMSKLKHGGQTDHSISCSQCGWTWKQSDGGSDPMTCHNCGGHGQLMMKQGGEMIKRADGSYSKRGLWDNIRANKGSGKKPTSDMLKQERKIRAAEKAYGGDVFADGGINNPGFAALPDYVQHNILSHLAEGGEPNIYLPQGFVNPNWARQSQSEEVDRAGDATVLSVRGTKLANQKIQEQARAQQFLQNNPGVNIDALRNDLVNKYGTMKDGDFFPNQQYLKQGARMVQVTPASSDQVVANYKAKQQGYKKGGSTYSAGVFYDIGGTNPWQVQLSDDEMNRQFANDMQQTTAMDAAQAANPAALSTVASAAKNPFSLKKATNAVYNKMADEMINPYSMQNALGMVNNVVDGFNNRKAYNDNLDRQRQNYSTDDLYQVTGNNATTKGQYDMNGIFVPNKIGGALSFTGMNQKYGMAEGGIATDRTSMSFIPSELSTVASPFINMEQPVFDYAAPPTAAVANSADAKANFSLSADFEDYAQKAQKYLDRTAPGTDVRGVDLAGAAQAAYEKHGKLVPVELALAQMTQEGYLANGSKPNKPQRTKNPFNVGNTDSGSVVNHNSVQSGIQAYYDLMATKYLKTKSPEELLQNFTNGAGSRYATSPKYEKSLRNIIGNMKFEQGGELMLTEQQIDYIRAMGGEVEFL